jgi:hypothetical protein
VKSNLGMMQMASVVLFLVTGAFWAGIVLVGGGVYLGWGAVTAVLSGVFLLAFASQWVTRPLAIASCLFGLVLTVYQLYLGLSVLGTALQTAGIYTSALFAVFTVIYLYLLSSLLRPEKS